jgi:hypothetical protein
LTSNAVGKYQFYIKDGSLVRGVNATPLAVRAIDTPDLANPATLTTPILSQTLIRISDVGATAVCFNLQGISPDGKNIAPDALKAVDTIIAQLTHRTMGGVCKVFGPGAPTDPKVRLVAAKTAGQALKKDVAIIYWIDGPDAAELVKMFKAAAPDLIVAAPAGGDLTVGAAPGPLSVVVGSIPSPLSPKMHCVLPDTPAILEALDKALADPIESQPWTPDNSVLTEEERKDGWIALFDGKTLNGWTITGPNKDGFVARNGLIEWNSGGAQQLRTRDRYADIVMRFDFKVAKGKNTGVQFHTPRANRASTVGFEFQIMGDHEKDPDKDSTGSIYDVIPPKMNATNPDGEWNTVEITLQGPRVKAILNGKVVQDLSFDDNEDLKYRLRKGFIVITDHGGYCAYRNLRLKKL